MEGSTNKPSCSKERPEKNPDELVQSSTLPVVAFSKTLQNRPLTDTMGKTHVYSVEDSSGTNTWLLEQAEQLYKLHEEHPCGQGDSVGVADTVEDTVDELLPLAVVDPVVVGEEEVEGDTVLVIVTVDDPVGDTLPLGLSEGEGVHELVTVVDRVTVCVAVLDVV